MNDKSGWYPIHTAAYYKQDECINVLVKHGADVLQPTEKILESTAVFSTFHLTAYTQLKHNLSTIKKRETMDRHLKRSYSDKGDFNRVDNIDRFQTKSTVDVLLKHLLSKTVQIIDEGNYGTILHVLSGIDHYEGVKKLTGSPFYHPVDILNSHGISPLLMALETRSLRSAAALLEYDVNIFIVHPTLDQSPLQILLQKASSIQDVHLEIVEKLLRKGNSISMFCQCTMYFV